jgi:hypothetical protein
MTGSITVSNELAIPIADGPVGGKGSIARGWGWELLQAPRGT